MPGSWHPFIVLLLIPVLIGGFAFMVPDPPKGMDSRNLLARPFPEVSGDISSSPLPPSATSTPTTTPPVIQPTPPAQPATSTPSTPPQAVPPVEPPRATSTPPAASSTPPASSATTTPSIPPLILTIPPLGYILSFSDEFGGSSLDRTKWKTRYVYADGTLDFLNDERQRYRDNGNHIVSNGTLKLIAKKVDDDESSVEYESGMIRSTYLLRYGYVEARVKLPDGKGIWPAFWLNSDKTADGALKWPPEIDIFEYVIDGKDELPDMIHMGVINKGAQGHKITYRDPAYNTRWGYYKNPDGSLADEWHTVGALWDEKGVTMYLDGKKIVTIESKWVYSNGDLAAPAHILLNLAVGGSWAGRNGIDDSAFPQAFEIDYVRAYKRG